MPNVVLDNNPIIWVKFWFTNKPKQLTVTFFGSLKTRIAFAMTFWLLFESIIILACIIDTLIPHRQRVETPSDWCWMSPLINGNLMEITSLLACNEDAYLFAWFCITINVFAFKTDSVFVEIVFACQFISAAKCLPDTCPKDSASGSVNRRPNAKYDLNLDGVCKTSLYCNFSFWLMMMASEYFVYFVLHMLAICFKRYFAELDEYKCILVFWEHYM